MAEPRAGGRLPQFMYEMPKPRSWGTGRWPFMKFENVTDDVSRDVLEMWQDLVHDIRDQRKSLGLSQVEAAARAGVSPNTYEALERGEAWGSVPTLLKIMIALELTLEQTTQVRVKPRRAQ